MRHTPVYLVISLLVFFSLSMVSKQDCSFAAKQMPVIKIARQFGLVYAPLMIADKLHIFEKNGLKPIYKEYGSDAAVGDALTSGEVDVGFMGIPPFLISWDKHCPWKIAMGFVVIPVGLVTNDPRIKSLRDFKGIDKITIPSPGSVQHILLAMAAEKVLGSPNALDHNIMTMPHADVSAALISKRGITTHFATPPYLFQELSQCGFHLIIDDRKIFGRPFCFNVGVASKIFHDNKPMQYLGFVNAINDSIFWINHNIRAAAILIAPEFNLTPEKTLQYMTWSRMNYTTKPYGLIEFAYFMKRAGFLKKVPRNLAEIAWENVKL